MESRMARTSLIHLLALVLALAPTACGGAPAAAPLQIDGKTLTEWEADLESPQSEVQAAALDALAQAETPPLELFAARLESKQAAVRAAAIRGLGAAGPAALPWAAELASYLEEDAEGFDEAGCRAIRNAAIHTLGKIGPKGFSSMAHLLASRSAIQRRRVAYAMLAFVADLEDGTKVLLPLVEDEDPFVRREAVRGLGLAGKGDERACQALLLALKDDHPEVVRYAAVSIGGIGGRSDREGRALAELLYAHQTVVRAAAAYGLGLMGEEAGPFAKPMLDLLQNDSKRVVRIQAARAYWRISGESAPALAELKRDLACTDDGLCRDALNALAEFGGEASPLVPELTGMLEKESLRREVVLVLGAIGPAAKAAVPSLQKTAATLGPKDEELRQEIDKALAAIGAAG